MTNKIPKDHYVPQCYLDAFAIEGLGMDESHINQYMKDKVVPPRIKDVASEKKFYNFTDKKTGKTSREIDDFFTQIEGWASPILKKIISEEKIELTDEELEKLSIFIAALAVRTPGFINQMSSMRAEAMKEIQAVEAMNKEAFHKSHGDTGIDKEHIEEYRKFLLNKEYGLEFKDSAAFFVAHGIQMMPDIADTFYNEKYWHLLVSEGGRVFVTSDNPVSVYRSLNTPPILSSGFKGGTILLTISPKHALLLRNVPYEDRVIMVNRKQVDEINKHLTMSATEYIFSNLNSNDIYRMYKESGNKHYQTIKATRVKFTPYTFFGTKTLPPEPLFQIR